MAREQLDMFADVLSEFLEEGFDANMATRINSGDKPRNALLYRSRVQTFRGEMTAELTWWGPGWDSEESHQLHLELRGAPASSTGYRSAFLRYAGPIDERSIVPELRELIRSHLANDAIGNVISTATKAKRPMDMERG